MVESMMLKSVGWRDGGTVFVILVILSCCKIYDKYKGVSKAKEEDSVLLKLSLNTCKLKENLSFELHTAGHNTRCENIILNEATIAYNYSNNLVLLNLMIIERLPHAKLQL